MITNLLKYIYKSQKDYSIYDVRDFINENVSLLHYSYKLNDDYTNFCESYLSRKKVDNLYPDINKFCSLHSYSETRFLSLGQCTQDFIIQWTCRMEFYKTTLLNNQKLTSKQQKTMKENVEYFQNNTFKFFFLLLDYILNAFNKANLIFQKENNQLHKLHIESRKLIVQLV